MALVAVACVPSSAPPPDAGGTDAGVPDSGSDEPDSGVPPDTGSDSGIDTGVEVDTGVDVDSGVVDTGLPSHCPTDVNPACTSAADCEADIAPPTNCDYCVPSNFSLCADATCERPPTLDAADVYGIVVQVNPVLPELSSIGAIAMAERTAGERAITCEDVYAGRIDLADRCYNVLETRSVTVLQSGDTYTVSLAGFASSQRTLFLLYGFTQTQARGAPVGLSCTEVDVGPPMGGMQTFIAGDGMRPL